MKKELLWLFGTCALAVILMLSFFGMDIFNADATFDINIHDTYFVIVLVHFFWPVVIFVFLVFI